MIDMTTSMIRVALADEHQVVRRGLATLLLAFDDLQLAGEAQNGAQVLEICAMSQPDVLLFDLMMPGPDGIEAIRTVRTRFPDIEVIVLTNWDECDLVKRALAAGADGYLLKSMDALELATTIRTAHAGR